MSLATETDKSDLRWSLIFIGIKLIVWIFFLFKSWREKLAQSLDKRSEIRMCSHGLRELVASCQQNC